MNDQILQGVRDNLVNAEAMLRGIHSANLLRESDTQELMASTERVGRLVVDVARARMEFEYWFMPYNSSNDISLMTQEELPF